MRVFLALATVAVLVFGFGSTANAERPDVSADLIKPGTLLVGTDSPFPPFQFGSGPGYKGFDIDLVNAMAKKLRLKVEFKDTPFDSIFQDLDRGKFDLVASAATITPERRRLVSFTKPNFVPLQSLVVRPDSRIRSMRHLSRVKVGVQSATSGELLVRSGTNARKIVGFSNGRAVIRALKRGRVGAIVLDQVVVHYERKRGQRGFKTVQNVSTGQRYGYAVDRSSKGLLRGMNWAFGKIKADGRFKRIYRKWFGINPAPSLRR